MDLLLHQVWNACFDCMLLVGPDGQILQLNRAAARLFSASPPSLIGTAIDDWMTDGDWRRWLSGRKGMTGISFSAGPHHLVGNVLYLEEDGHYLLVWKNITQTRQLHDQLQEMHIVSQRFAQILDQLEEGICVVDAYGQILYYNRKMGELQLQEPESVRGRLIQEIWPGEALSHPLMKTLRTGQPISRQETRFGRSGKTLTILSRTIPLSLTGQVSGALEICKDITDQRQLTESIVRLQKPQRRTAATAASAAACLPETRFDFAQLIHASRDMSQTIEMARRASRSASSVLIVGETGTGKELFAQSIHQESPRRHKPFIAQNCAALPETLLEGLLFGTAVGSFTGAVDRPGLFEQAHGGTLLLDELNAMSIDLQAKLLRVLQERKAQRLGSARWLDIDVRVIATMNEDPLEAIAKGRLREDLYYRLAVVCLEIPPLRKRKEDIPVLIRHFLAKHAAALEVTVDGLDPEVLQVFLRYTWPGNVRQLEHVIEGCLNVLDPDERSIRLEHLPPTLREHMRAPQPHPAETEPVPWTGSLPEQMAQLERHLICRALQTTGGNLSKASERLGISRQLLRYKLNKHRLPVPDDKK